MDFIVTSLYIYHCVLLISTPFPPSPIFPPSLVPLPHNSSISASLSLIYGIHIIYEFRVYI